MQGPLGALDRVLQWVVRLVWLNVCWVVFTVLGAVVLGIGPATSAAFTVASRWADGDADVPIAQSMWAQYRRDVRRVTAPVLVLGVTTIGLLLTLLQARDLSPIASGVGQGLASIGLLMVLAAAPHVLWVATRETPGAPRRWSEVLLAAFAVGVGKPILTAALLALTAGWPVLLILSGWPGLLPVLGASVPIAAAARLQARALTHRPCPSS